MDPRREARKLNRMLAYMLGRSPSEFGLVPLADGRIKTRELIKALHEEDGWRHIRAADIEALLRIMDTPAVESDSGWIRAVDRTGLATPMAAIRPPALVYTAIRRRAWPTVRESGLQPGGLPWVVLSSERKMAVRIGRRSDPEPVVLEVATNRARSKGVELLDAGPPLLCSPYVPASCLHGPPVEREKRKPGPTEGPKDPVEAPEPGSFRLRPFDPRPARRRSRRKPAWRRDRRRKNERGDPWGP